MSENPSDLRYRESHEWVRVEDDGTVIVGISDHAQGELGDMVFVELPEPGMSYDQGEACAVIESVKAASDVYAPLLVNSDPYGDGWLFRLIPSDASQIDGLMDAAAYAELQEE